MQVAALVPLHRYCGACRDDSSKEIVIRGADIFRHLRSSLFKDLKKKKKSENKCCRCLQYVMALENPVLQAADLCMMV